jgi:hypothetical protein
MDVDESERSLIVFRFRGGRIEDAHLSRALEAVRGAVARKQRFALIADASAGVDVSATQRRMVTEFFRANEAELKKWCAGLVTVSTSTLVRGAITAIGWVFPAPMPSHVAATFADARRWALSKMAETKAS